MAHTVLANTEVAVVHIMAALITGYQDAAFATVTVCEPGSTTACTTIDNLLVDTGSVGLRVFDSEVSSLTLPALNASNGSPAYNCATFVDGDYMWGQVEQADVTMGSEAGSSVPIQVISSSDTGVATSCSNGSTTNVNTSALMGANGILGVGSEPTDCALEGTNVCAPTSGLTSAPYPAYYTCSGSSCTPTFVAASSQVTNPVVDLPTDNNGVIVELPSVSGSEASVTGSLIFGIGTESNNALPSSDTVLTLSCDDFTTVFDGHTFSASSSCASDGSFIDSGSSGLFFPNETGIPTCPSTTDVGDLSSWYCPSSPDSLSATNEGANRTSVTTSFTVDNAQTLFTSLSTGLDNAYSGLAGVEPTGVGFDWGLPFFFGLNVYSSIDGQIMPSGEPPAPWWAY